MQDSERPVLSRRTISNSSSKPDDERLKGVDPKMVELIKNEVLIFCNFVLILQIRTCEENITTNLSCPVLR